MNKEEEESKTEINEQQSYPDASPDDLPFQVSLQPNLKTII